MRVLSILSISLLFLCCSTKGKPFEYPDIPDDINVTVTGVKLSQTDPVSLSAGEKLTLTATVEPDSATQKELLWKSSNPTVAAVDVGIVTALSPGRAGITVSTLDGSKSASITIMVINPEFIARKGSKLYYNNQQWRGMGFNIPGLTINENSAIATGKNRKLPAYSEIEDALKSMVQMGMNVVRIMPFSITYKDPAGKFEVLVEDAYIQSPGQYNETAFRCTDKVLQLANELDIKVLIPFFDCHPYFGGIIAFTGLYGKSYQAYYTDSEMKQATKDFYYYVINRTNTLTGMKYKDDKTILAWELGNELSSQANAATLDPWSREMSAYIKSIDPNHLVCDGRGSMQFADNTLSTIPDIDIIDCHYSPNYDQTAPIAIINPDMTKRVLSDLPVVCGKYNKVLIAGEGPSYATPDKLMAFIDQGFAAGLSVCMPWSFRPHFESGGFLFHTEGLFPKDVNSPGYDVYPENRDINWYSWHWPGLPRLETNNWEITFMSKYRAKAYQILHGQNTPPPCPVCDPPVLLSALNRADIRFRGSVGGKNYDVQRSDDGVNWYNIVTGYIDDVNIANAPNAKMVNDGSATDPGSNTYYRVRANNSDGVPSNWSVPLKYGATYMPPNE